jgi:hypothetical protein
VADQPRVADFAIWLVALALYAFDAARLLSPRQLLLVEAGGQRLASVFSAYPFTITGRVLAVAPLTLPHRGVFVAPWGQAWSDEAALRAALRGMDALRGTLLPARVLAATAFLLLFVVGPLLTVLLGTDPAVLGTAAVLYPTALAGVVVLWWRRRAFGLSARHTALLSLEVLVCPAFLPNLVRKITTSHPLETDGGRLLLARAPDDVKTEFLDRLSSRAEELINEAADDEQRQAALRTYLAAARAAR